jgi:hypothetical protein
MGVSLRHGDEAYFVNCMYFLELLLTVFFLGLDV